MLDQANEAGRDRLLLQQLESQLSLQERQRDSLTQKAIALLAATIALGALGKLPAPSPSETSGFHCFPWGPYLLAGVAFLMAGLTAAASLWPIRYSRPPDPRGLVEHYGQAPDREILRQLMGEFVHAYEAGAAGIRLRNRFLKVSLICLMIGLILFLVLVLGRAPGRDGS